VLRVGGCELRVSGCVLRVSSCELRDSGYVFRVAGFELRVSGYELRVTSHGLRVTGREFTSQLMRCTLDLYYLKSNHSIFNSGLTGSGILTDCFKSDILFGFCQGIHGGRSIRNIWMVSGWSIVW